MNVNTLRAGVGTVVFAALGIVAVGCGGAHLTQLKEAAAADLNCPKSRIHILNSGKTRDIEACGQRATYHWEDGDWRMIARSTPAPGPQPVMKTAPAVAPAQPAPVNAPSTATGTPSQPPPSQPPPAAGGKQL